MTERTPEDLLRRIEALDELIGETFPAGQLEMPGRPGALRAIENLWLARRTLGSVHHLMAFTITGKDRDRTEDAAVLTRRLLELLSDTYWMTDWDETDPDHQALRSLLAEFDERRKKLQFIESIGSDDEAIERARAELENQQEDVNLIKEELEGNGAPTTPRANTFDILNRVSPSLAFYWAFESDVAHGGMVGRNLQRTEDIDIGAEAPDWRRVQILETALAAVADVFIRTVRLCEMADDERDAVGKRVAEIMGLDQR
jgi:hypothetical protein